MLTLSGKAKANMTGDWFETFLSVFTMVALTSIIIVLWILVYPILKR